MKQIVFILITLFAIGIGNINAQPAEIILKIVPDNTASANQSSKKSKQINSSAIQTVWIEYAEKKISLEEIFILFSEKNEVSNVSTNEEELPAPPEPASFDEKYDSKVDKFLNRVGDPSDGAKIFKEFLTNIDPAKLHPRSKELYLLVEAIHHLDSLVSVSNEMKAREKDQIKANLKKAADLDASIISYTDDKKCKLYYLLSEPQKEFYRNAVKNLQKLQEDYK